MSRYTGLPVGLKNAVYERDCYRCRWCGSTSAYGYDVHHIQYRRGYAYDVVDNLVTLCRSCHTFVHDSYQIPKRDAQDVLSHLVVDDGQGRTGLSVWRSLKDSKRVTVTPSTGPVGRLLPID